MSIHDVCRRCGHAVAWIIRPVREIGHLMTVESIATARGFDHRGWYEAAVCARCGLTQLWARDYDARRAAEPGDPCRECGDASGWTIAPAPDVIDARHVTAMQVTLAPVKSRLSLLLGGVGWRGSIAVRICAGCGAAAWSCRAESVDPRDLGPSPPSARSCLRCQGPCTTAPLDDHSPYDGRSTAEPRAIVVAKPGSLLLNRRGGFEVDVCLRCFHTDWYGTQLGRLRESAEDGVFRVRRGDIAPDDGPYR